MMVMAAACIPIPSEAILCFSGAMIKIDPSHGFSVIAVALTGVAGDLAGASLAYWVGHKGGRPFLNKYGKYVLIRKSDIDRSEAYFGKFGEVTALFSRMVPLIRAFSALPAGISKMNYGRFLVFSLLGSLPWCFGLTYAGFSLGAHWESVQKVLHKADLGVSVLIVAGLAFWIWRHFKPETESAAAA